MLRPFKQGFGHEVHPLQYQSWIRHHYSHSPSPSVAPRPRPKSMHCISRGLCYPQRGQFAKNLCPLLQTSRTEDFQHLINKPHTMHRSCSQQFVPYELRYSRLEHTKGPRFKPAKAGLAQSLTHFREDQSLVQGCSKTPLLIKQFCFILNPIPPNLGQI